MNHIDEDEKSLFLQMLQLRRADFDKALEINKSLAEKERILAQYHRFAHTVHSCLSRPSQLAFYIDLYHKQQYYPVGITEVIEEPVRHKLSLAASILGAAIILASLVSFPFNPLIGAILLPIGITLLAPAIASIMTPDPLNTLPKKEEEKAIFQLGAQLMDPSLFFDETQNNERQIITII
ncbi:hypothetical protein [Legionella wadsworthii]|uniref:hypothetical protein n=1 Tax=Legionella wadsworthii TaxID=28088 RepID=UPI001F5E7AC3|nr:hypothetical protein [Legionella wadsworthii]